MASLLVKGLFDIVHEYYFLLDNRMYDIFLNEISVYIAKDRFAKIHAFSYKQRY